MSNFFTPLRSLSLSEVAEITSAKIIGNANISITSVASLEKAKNTDICFFNSMKYEDVLKKSLAGACFIEEKYIHLAPKNTALLIVKDPYLAFAKVALYLFPLPKFEEYISSRTAIANSAKIGKGCHIGNFVTIGENVTIGDNVYIDSNTSIGDSVTIGSNGYIYSNVSIKYATIGNRFIIHDGVRIGQDGFGFAPNAGGHIKIPQIASVIVGDDVELGANTCVDRGALHDTVIGQGTKIDNMVQIAHGVRIGKYCFLSAATAIAGSTVIGDYVLIGGNSSIAPHLVIGDGVKIAGMSGIANNIEAGETVVGSPAINHKSFWKLQVMLRKMIER